MKVSFMMKDTEDIKKWKNILCSWNQRTSIVKMSMLLKEVYGFNATPIKIPKAFLCRTKTILKFIWNHKRP